VELRDGAAAHAAGIVEALHDVSEVLLDGRHLRARVTHGAQAVPGILSALESGGVAVAAVTIARPSLDDVYLHYTGRDFRTEDEGGGS
jgi:ABC-2 type transport system ATP-binding protein